MERMTGVEPASKAWEAFVLPMNYIRRVISAHLQRQTLSKSPTHTVPVYHVPFALASPLCAVLLPRIRLSRSKFESPVSLKPRGFNGSYSVEGPVSLKPRGFNGLRRYFGFSR